ncbi:DUF5071 domain-containing protein [Lysinibacillus odysseyi]|uniref:DUF5071 domain-containing protein n=1 Tax=Lysinibacillus odysseyi TaxID=202611 RepID=UPI00056B396A|nr:DUF5071 domain-containing protein [Lysinibacillus odysseyi]
MIPRDKFDELAMLRLQMSTREEIIPILPELLVWIQDMNWPIAAKMAELLRAYPEETVPHIKEILKGTDSIWKYWCLLELVKPMNRDHQLVLKEDLLQLIHHPSDDDRLEEVDVLAAEILKMVVL